MAQTPKTVTSASTPQTKKIEKTDKSTSKKKVTIDFEDEIIKGNYDAPELIFLNSRKAVKYKDLFNTRTHFIDEIESNRGLFNAN